MGSSSSKPQSAQPLANSQQSQSPSPSPATNVIAAAPSSSATSNNVTSVVAATAQNSAAGDLPSLSPPPYPSPPFAFRLSSLYPPALPPLPANAPIPPFKDQKVELLYKHGYSWDQWLIMQWGVLSVAVCGSVEAAFQLTPLAKHPTVMRRLKAPARASVYIAAAAMMYPMGKLMMPEPKELSEARRELAGQQLNASTTAATSPALSSASSSSSSANVASPASSISSPSSSSSSSRIRLAASPMEDRSLNLPSNVPRNSWIGKWFAAGYNYDQWILAQVGFTAATFPPLCEILLRTTKTGKQFLLPSSMGGIPPLARCLIYAGGLAGQYAHLKYWSEPPAGWEMINNPKYKQHKQ